MKSYITVTSRATEYASSCSTNREYAALSYNFTAAAATTYYIIILCRHSLPVTLYGGSRQSLPPPPPPPPSRSIALSRSWWPTCVTLVRGRRRARNLGRTGADAATLGGLAATAVMCARAKAPPPGRSIFEQCAAKWRRAKWRLQVQRMQRPSARLTVRRRPSRHWRLETLTSNDIYIYYAVDVYTTINVKT